MTRKCAAHKRNGDRCSADAQSGKDVCVFHDPTKATDGQRARRAGGLTRSQAVKFLPLDTPDHRLGNTSDISALLAASINQLRRGQLDPKVANAIGYLASVMLRSFEQGRTEERVAGVAVTGSTFRERFKSLWLLRKEAEMIPDFEAEAAAATKSPP